MGREGEFTAAWLPGRSLLALLTLLSLFILAEGT
jgi:hypothetical protein